MTLQEQLSEDLTQALKSKDQLRTGVIRLVKAAIQYKEIELKGELDEADMAKLLVTLVKQRREAAECYHQANRDDLARKELQEITIIERYQPQAISEEELAETVRAVIQQTGATTIKDMGRVMKEAMSQLAGKPVDGKRVNELVRATLQ